MKLNKSIVIATINIEAAPNYVVRKAFENIFEKVIDFDWFHIFQKVGIRQTWCELQTILAANKPDYLFMQVQNPDLLAVEDVKEFSIYTKVITWTGDVRDREEWLNWYEQIGKQIHLTLFSSEHQANILKQRGVNAYYLQIGFDNVIYNATAKNNTQPEIVFCANNYYDAFPLSSYRREAATLLKRTFGDRFQVFGVNWNQIGIATRQLNNLEEAQHYANAKICISISHFNYDRYYSDRLLRILGVGGGMALTHNYIGIQKDFKVGYHLDYFDSSDSLIEKCNYYLTNDKERNFIAKNGMDKAHSECTWEYRCKELISLLQKQ